MRGRTVRRARRQAPLAAAGAVAVVLTGCSSASDTAPADVATSFEDPAASSQSRCDLLAPATLATFESQESAPCADAIGDVPLSGGGVTAVEVWGGNAQVRMGGETVFLTETDVGWRITAAGCEPQGEAPYDCQVEGP